MKKYLHRSLLIVLCILFLFPASAFAGQEAVTAVSLEEALQIAYQNNPDLRKSNLELDKAQIQRDDARQLIDFIPASGLVSPETNAVFNAWQQAEIGLATAKKAQTSEKELVSKEVISTYIEAVKYYNDMESSRLTLQNMEHQKRIAGMNMGLGLMSELAYQKLDNSINKVQEGYKATQAMYEGAIASLRYLLGQSAGWNPGLSSRAVLAAYPRNELSVELNRGTSQSVLVYTKKALLDIENSKEDWILPNLSTKMQNINLNMAELDYEQATRDAKAAIEKLYYGIDTLEGQIQVSEASYREAQKDLEIAKLKFDVGVIPRYSMTPEAETLSGAELDEQKARLDLENLKADLAKMKADFAYLTGQTVYDSKDWEQ